MTERPILFSAPMVRALLDGRKTQTRRMVKGEKPGQPLDWLNAGFDPDFVADPANALSPYGVPGDLLWVRETTRSYYLPNFLTGEPTNALCGQYVADDEPVVEEMGFDLSWWYSRPICPAIHMPRNVSRITLRITDVRVERLQDISEADAIAEGLYKSYPDDEDRAWLRDWTEDQTGAPPTEAEVAQFERGVWMAPGAPQGWGLTKAERQRDQWGPTAQFAYRLVWEAINGPGSWDANPWVWAVSFERVQP